MRFHLSPKLAIHLITFFQLLRLLDREGRDGLTCSEVSAFLNVDLKASKLLLTFIAEQFPGFSITTISPYRQVWSHLGATMPMDIKFKPDEIDALMNVLNVCDAFLYRHDHIFETYRIATALLPPDLKSDWKKHDESF